MQIEYFTFRIIKNRGGLWNYRFGWYWNKVGETINWILDHVMQDEKERLYLLVIRNPSKPENNVILMHVHMDDIEIINS